ncbi:putative myosin light chain kinase 3 [Cichlidogyrus casuarinus]|uniref:Myosin light chain kinase 3 n=1 Tax=Cichlidogyrus casuarinus TaxID=1844966 RepID=A0ABD2PLQ9_9PLAT
MKLKRKGTLSKKQLKKYFYRRKWQKAVNAIIALQRMGCNFSSRNQPTHLPSIDGTLRSFQRATAQPRTQPGTPRKNSLTFTKNEAGSTGNLSQIPQSQLISKLNTVKNTRSVSMNNKPPTVPSSPSLSSTKMPQISEKSPSLHHIATKSHSKKESSPNRGFFASLSSSKHNSEPNSPNANGDSPVSSPTKNQSKLTKSSSFMQKLHLGSSGSETGGKKPSIMSKILRKDGPSNKNSADETNNNSTSSVSPKRTSNKVKNGSSNGLAPQVEQEKAEQQKKPELKLGAIKIRTAGASRGKELKVTPVPKSSRPSIEGKIGFFANLADGKAQKR